MLPFSAPSARAAVTEAWVHRYDSNALNHSQDRAFKVVRDAAGDVMVAGTTRDDITTPGMLVIKYSGVDGAVIWQKRYAVLIAPGGGTLYDRIEATAVDGDGNLIVTGLEYGNYITTKYSGEDGTPLWASGYPARDYNVDFPPAMAVDADGNVLVTGSLKDGIDNPDEGILYYSDYYTAKYAAADGALLWAKRYDGPAHRDDRPQAVAVGAGGDVIVTGFSHRSDGACDYYTAKYAAADGALLWDRRFSGTAVHWHFPQGVAMDAAGNAVVTGSLRALNGDSACYTAKYAAADGALLWEKRYSGLNDLDDYGTVVAVDGDGNVVVTGTSDSDFFHSTPGDFYTAKYAGTNGALLWERRYNGPGNGWDEPYAMAVDASGNVAVTGYSAGGAENSISYTAKYAASDGSVIWEKRTAQNYDIVRDLTLEDGGDVVVTGTINEDFYTARYAAGDGAALWEKRYDGPANRSDQARAVAVDAAGNVVVTGESDASTNSYDYYTAKYATADGALLWEQRYNGPGNSDDKASAMALDANGNVVVTGTSFFSRDYYTVKYAAANGAVLWEKHGPENFHDKAQAIAVDGGGNVVVTGSSFDGTDTDFYTAKYAAADGALLWEKRFHATIYNTYPAVTLAVDGSGNVIVAGTIDGPAGDYHGDFYTAKYAAADGTLLWEKRYSGLATYSEDHVACVAVDGSGNVLVTGTSGPEYVGDYYTAKYAAASGALLWEKRYHGASDEAAAHAVTVDAGGNAVVTGNSGTFKYAAADGAVLWEKRSTGAAVAVDGGGNVVVTGSGYATKYAAADGALLWSRGFSVALAVGGPHGVALGPGGMVAVTGSTDGGNFISDYATVVLRELPGPASFAAWAAGLGLTGAAAAPSADPDHDGIPNAAEYILGGNPASAATPRPAAVTISGGNMLFTFSRDDLSETPDVTLTVETSLDLMNWPGVWPTVFFIGAISYPGVTITENGNAPDTITVVIPPGTNKAKFARLKVTIAP